MPSNKSKNIALNVDQHWQLIADQVTRTPKITRAWVSTFGLAWSEQAAEIIRIIPKVQMLVGLPQKCTANFELVAIQYLSACPNLKIYLTQDHHMKVWLFERQKRLSAVIGGRNVNNSSWQDLSVYLSNHRLCQEILECMKKTLKKSGPFPISTFRKYRKYRDELRDIHLEPN